MKLEVSCTSELWNTQELEERVLCLQQMPELVSVEKYSPEELNRIQVATERIREDSEVLIVIGTGADYEKAHRMMKFYGHHFYNVLPKEELVITYLSHIEEDTPDLKESMEKHILGIT